MKFNISNPETGQQKTIEFEDENRFRHLYDKKMG
jgi:small subunit ribosomal protein S6e